MCIPLFADKFHFEEKYPAYVLDMRREESKKVDDKTILKLIVETRNGKVVYWDFSFVTTNS